MKWPAAEKSLEYVKENRSIVEIFREYILSIEILANSLVWSILVMLTLRIQMPMFPLLTTLKS